MIPVDGEVLRAVAPRFSGAKAKAQERIIDSIDGVLESTLASFQVDTRLRIAHFLAQTRTNPPG